MKSNDYFFTVIIPAYNRESFITTSVGSALRQTFPPDLTEIIVVDDASTDQTASLAAGLSHRVKVLRCKSRGNQNISRNIGLNSAQGTFIAFLDSDDEYLPDYLSSAYDLLSKQTDIDLLITNFYTKKSASLESYKFSREDFSRETIIRAVIGHAFPQTFSSLIARKTILQEMQGIDETFYRYTDREFTLSILSNKKNVGLRNLDGVIKHQHPGSISKNVKGQVNTLLLLIAKHQKLISEYSDKNILNYLFLRAFLGSISKFDVPGLCRSLGEFYITKADIKDLIKRKWSILRYIDGKKQRKAIEAAVILRTKAAGNRTAPVCTRKCNPP